MSNPPPIGEPLDFARAFRAANPSSSSLDRESQFNFIEAGLSFICRHAAHIKNEGTAPVLLHLDPFRPPQSGTSGVDLVAATALPPLSGRIYRCTQNLRSCVAWHTESIQTLQSAFTLIARSNVKDKAFVLFDPQGQEIYLSCGLKDHSSPFRMGLPAAGLSWSVGDLAGTLDDFHNQVLTQSPALRRLLEGATMAAGALRAASDMLFLFLKYGKGLNAPANGSCRIQQDEMGVLIRSAGTNQHIGRVHFLSDYTAEPEAVAIIQSAAEEHERRKLAITSCRCLSCSDDQAPIPLDAPPEGCDLLHRHIEINY